MDDLIRLDSRTEAHYVFLFSDVEGSTARWAAFPFHMGAALARHDELLRDVVAAAGGGVFKTTGDGGYEAHCGRSFVDPILPMAEGLF